MQTATRASVRNKTAYTDQAATNNIQRITRLTRRSTKKHVEQAMDLVKTSFDPSKPQQGEKKTSSMPGEEATTQVTRSRRNIKVPKQHERFYQTIRSQTKMTKTPKINSTSGGTTILESSSLPRRNIIKQTIVQPKPQKPNQITMDNDRTEIAGQTSTQIEVSVGNKLNKHDEATNSKREMEMDTENKTINISNVTIRKPKKLPSLDSNKAIDTNEMDIVIDKPIIRRRIPIVVLKNLNNQDIDQLTHSNSTQNVSPGLSADKLPAKKLKKPLKRLQQRTTRKSPIRQQSSKSANTEQQNKLPDSNRLPVYKQMVNSKNLVPLNDDNSIYDYFTNSQDSSVTEQCSDNSMRKIYKKLQRQNKIVLSRKPNKKPAKSKKNPKPLWGNEMKRLNFKKNLIDLKTFIQKDLLAKRAKPNSEPVPNAILIDSDNETECGNENDFNFNPEETVHVDKSKPNFPEKSDTNDDPLEFIDLTKSVKKTYPSKSPQKCGDTSKLNANTLYQLALKKPSHQSTPVQASSGVLNESSASPWRAVPGQVQSFLIYGKSGAGRPASATTSVRFQEPSEETPTTSQISIRTDSRKELTLASGITAAKRLRYSQFEMDRNISAGTSTESFKSTENTNLSNIENIEPHDHLEIQSTQKETITLAGVRKTLPRSPLKSLAIRNIRLSVHDLEVSFIYFLFLLYSRSVWSECNIDRFAKI